MDENAALLEHNVLGNNVVSILDAQHNIRVGLCGHTCGGESAWRDYVSLIYLGSTSQELRERARGSLDSWPLHG
jgi:hypothetical protein